MLKNFLFLLFFTIVFNDQIYAQSLSVQGKVTSSRLAIKQALVTFVDEIDTTKKFSATTDNSGNYQIGLPTSVRSNKNNLPDDFELAQNYPNPFSSSTAIAYSINKQSDIKITIYDLLGREVRRFSVGYQTTGFHHIVWDGLNNLGQRITSGIYFYKLQAGGKSRIKKMISMTGGKDLVSLPQINIPEVINNNSKLSKLSETGSYTVRIDNTDNTSPMIIAKQIENITVEDDTTINFSVEYIPTATIDFDSLHQIIRGFGASNIILWRPDMTDSEIETAFGNEDGQIGFTILRLMVEKDKNRWNLYVPAAKKALDMGATIIASPWHAPDDMVETVGGVSRVKYDKYDEYAAHLDSFNTYMANNSVPLYGLSVQNEPDITDQWTSWTSDEIFTFMKENAHAITGTRVMAPESFHFDRSYSDPILNDSTACANTDIICGHIYGGGLASYPLAEQKGKEVWMTEYLSGETDTENTQTLYWALDAAKSISNAMQADMSAYVWWYIVRYYGPISDGTNNSGSKGDVTKKGFAMSQFSKFIRPGDYRVQSAVYPPVMSNLYVTAYKDTESSRAVIVAINDGSSGKEVAFNLQNSVWSAFTVYTTSEDKDVVQGGGNYHH
ncbi:MAG: T9SS type A sorting domain-containing protein [Calditrichaceae bacterium]|nr:T9SS type A sorting domain-containing protein [Calditrichaceae bacterium]RQV94765.1 MAG: T9SS C-terminal target domain-containing protein [Calditrichota bacterium]